MLPTTLPVDRVVVPTGKVEIDRYHVKFKTRPIPLPGEVLRLLVGGKYPIDVEVTKDVGETGYAVGRRIRCRRRADFDD